MSKSNTNIKKVVLILDVARREACKIMEKLKEQKYKCIYIFQLLAQVLGRLKNPFTATPCNNGVQNNGNPCNDGNIL